MVCYLDTNSILLISMPFADIPIPSIQLSLLESYLKDKNIKTKSLHLYLFAAESYGLNNYTFLINPPNSPYSSQMVFSKYVFPNHWKKHNNEIKKYYNSSIAHDKNKKELFSFDEFVEKTDLFLNNIIHGVNWKDFDIIGFSLNYGQFLPSLAIAKQVKAKYPDKKIVFGGSTTMNDLGKAILESFDYVDVIISGEGEKALTLLAKNNESINQIPGLITKTTSSQIIHNSPSFIDLNTLPFVDFSSFYEQLNMTTPNIQQYVQLNSRLPIEISRGCWWNKCSFCNQQAYYPFYREKHIDRFVEELNYLSETYKMLSFQIIGSTLPIDNLRNLCKKIISLEKDFSFIAETRSDQLKSNDYLLLKKAGFHIIQTGIETFSKNLLKKMKKGTRIIDNIAALKFCKEYGIKNEYNIITNFPTENNHDFNETLSTISWFNQYLDPPRISPFVVGYKSPVYNQLKKYNVEKLIHKKADTLMFPKSLLHKNIHFFYDYKRSNTSSKNNWHKLVDSWKKLRNQLDITSVETKKLIDKLVFYYVDGKNFIKIYDKRNLKDVNIFTLNENERAVFIACNDIVHFKKLKQKLNELSENKLQSILHELVQNKIIYQEDNLYLSLPISLSKYLGIHKNIKNQYMKKKRVLLPS